MHPVRMNKGMEVRASCNYCGASVDPSRDQPCPSCGHNAGKRIYAVQTDQFGIEDSVSWARAREFLRYNWAWAVVLAAIVIFSPFVGLLIAEIWGIFAGLLLGVLRVPVGFFAITKVREITRGGKPVGRLVWRGY